MASERKKPGRKSLGPRKLIAAKVPIELYEKTQRVTSFTPQTLTGLVNEGLEMAVKKELDDYKKKNGVEMPKLD